MPDPCCPSPDELRLLLDGRAEAGRLSALREHLSGCGSCLEALDRLSDDPELVSWIDEAGPDGAETARRLVRGLARPEQIGPYAVEDEIGRGGMGIVYRARDRALGRVVALKVLPAGRSGDDASRRRFFQEVQAAARVEHDHLVRVYGTSTADDPRPYLVMELVRGPSLADRLREAGGPLAPREAADLVRQAALGLAAAHGAGLVHRDVKPANILIESATGRAKVGDFGLARLAGEATGLTSEGVLAGTPAYLSPEQARGDAASAGPAADVYALGVTLYECLAGEPPFRGTPHRIVQQILADEPRPPRSLNDRIPRDLQTIALRAMEKAPDRRYAGASALADDLARFLRGDAILARPTGPLGRLWKRARRRPVVSALAVLLALAVASGTGGVLWQWRRASASGREAERNLAHALRTIDGYFTRIGDNRLLDVPSLQPLRRELLADAATAYEQLARERPADPAVRVGLARARIRLAAVTAAVGSFADARSLLRRTLDDLDALIRRSPHDAGARDARLAAATHLAAVELKDSRNDACLETTARLIADAEAERRARPDALQPLETLYAARHDRGYIAWALRKPPREAIAELESALAANRELLRLRPDHPTYLRNVTRTTPFLADALARDGRPARGWALDEEAYAVAGRLHAEHPESLEYRFSLAPFEVTRGNRAMIDSLARTGPAAAGRLDDARRHFDAALDLVRGLVRENPEVDAYRGDLLGHLGGAVSVALASGRLDDVHAAAGEARSVAPGIRNSANGEGSVRSSLAALELADAYALSQEGRPDEALARLDAAEAELARLTPRERSSRPDLAMLEAFLACGRAAILAEAGRAEAAAVAWTHALQLAPPALRPLVELAPACGPTGPDQPWPAIDPGRALAAVPLADAVVASGPVPAVSYATYARLYAAAAAGATGEAQAHLRARAALCLEKAGQAGYDRDPARLERLRRDPNLATLPAPVAGADHSP